MLCPRTTPKVVTWVRASKHYLRRPAESSRARETADTRTGHHECHPKRVAFFVVTLSRKKGLSVLTYIIQAYAVVVLTILVKNHCVVLENVL